jgi:DNA-binding PadR family transcriptional regulator
MSDEIEFDLSNQEYLVMGLIGMAPQSGYTIISYFEDDIYRWSASPGSVYPMLKRLEKQRLVDSELEMIHETRPRKIYTLTPLGERVLDAWLRKPPDMPPLHENREMALLKFLFMEKRLPLEDILFWLKNYQDSLDMYDFGRRLFNTQSLQALKEYNLSIVHLQLILEANIMEVNTVRAWIQMARARLEAEAQHNGDINGSSEENGG